jgi:hypothetical protein
LTTFSFFWQAVQSVNRASVSIIKRFMSYLP